MNRGSIITVPALDGESTATDKKWQEAGTVWSIWMMASQDQTPFLSYQSVASRLYGPIREEEVLAARVDEVRDLVGRWRELFRPSAHPKDFEKWKNALDENFQRVRKKEPLEGSYPEWLLDLDVRGQEAQLAKLKQSVFRSQLRIRQGAGKSPPEDIKFGLDYIDSMRSALLDADKENRANMLERERDKRDAEKHRRDRWLVFLALLALLVPASVTAWTSYETHEQSVRENDLKEAENTLRETEIGLRRGERQSHDAEIQDRNLVMSKEADARFLGLLAKTYAAWLNGDKNQCIMLTGDLDSAFSMLANTKSNSLRLEHQGVRQLCIDTLTGKGNMAGRRIQAEQMIERARTVLKE